MVTQEQILLTLYNDRWFTPSKSAKQKEILDYNGNVISVPESYYHTYQDGESILIRVSNHGTTLSTWLKRRKDPSESLQNLSIVFSNEPITSKVITEPTKTVDKNGNESLTYTYFVVEQYTYLINNLSLKDFKKTISKVKSLDSQTVYTDPFKKKPSKKANRKVLIPKDEDEKSINPNTNPVHPRQMIVASNPENEVDAEGNVLPESLNRQKHIVLNETQLRQIIRETIKKIIA